MDLALDTARFHFVGHIDSVAEETVSARIGYCRLRESRMGVTVGQI